ncbi:MAG: efflux transporter outer membrane subunit [Akkermansiaceae bacterium]
MPFARHILSVLALLFAGCEAMKGPQAIGTLKLDAPATYAKAQSGQNERISTGWLSDFGDARMTQVVNEALKQNHDLQAAAYRLRAAKEGNIIRRAARLPSLSAGTSYRRSDSEVTATTENYSLSLNASWEPDLWGRLRNLERATRADYASSLADFRAARLSLAANTASAWCNLVTAELQLNLARTTVASYKRALPVVESRYKKNLLRAVDVQFARNNVASAERTLRIRELNRGNAARALELLLGRYPSASISSSSQLPSLSKNVPAGIPAQLIERRPDLQAERAVLYASAQRAEATRKNLLPNIRLSGGASGGEDSFKRVLDPTFLAYSAAASLSQTIYNGGALNANARAALQRNKAQLHVYSQTALRAFREVEAALQAETSLAEQEIFLKKEVAQTNIAEKRALDDITRGIEGSSFLEYLEAQRRAENARASLIRLRNDRLQNRIDLYLSLGGDFKTR